MSMATKRTRVSRTTPRTPGNDRAARVDANLRALVPELTSAERRRIVAVDRTPMPPFAPAWLVAFGARERSNTTALRAFLKVVRHDAQTLDRKVVRLAEQIVYPTPVLSRLIDLLAQIQVVALNHNAENIPQRPGRPREREARERVDRVAWLFGELGQRATSKRTRVFLVTSNPKSVFGRVVSAVLFTAGAGDSARYLKPYARSRD